MATSVSGGASEADTTRPQAGPLPQKRGEIGFQEGIHVQDAINSSVVALPARHPADRDLEAGSSPSSSPDQPSSGSFSPPNASAEASSTHKNPHTSLLSWLDPRPFLKQTKVAGILLGTLLRFILQVLILCGTITAWIIISMQVNKGDNTNPNGPASKNPSSEVASNGSPGIGNSAIIFVHVTFAVATLAQLLFLERSLFVIRAQRYAFNHPGSPLPRHARSAGSVGMGLAPWNRPPLPTYAATLAESGVGTGDVEDNIIAVPPPPAYGNTRGSTLLLSSFVRRSLLAGGRDDSSSRNHVCESRPSSYASSHRDRPVSYRIQDGDWEQQCDAERALRLADTLERLENSRSTRT